MRRDVSVPPYWMRELIVERLEDAGIVEKVRQFCYIIYFRTSLTPLLVMYTTMGRKV